jgi:hypothetical protein
MEQQTNKSTSIFDRFFNRSRSTFRTIVVCFVVLAVPVLAALLDGELEPFTLEGQWRTILFAPTITLYIWIISPFMTRAGENVISSLRPLVELDDEEFNKQVYAAEYINPRHEMLALILGGLLGVAAISTDLEPAFSWVALYWAITTILMYGILFLTIFVAIKSTGFNAALHRLPMRFDILRPDPFEAVGRQSLLLALVFVGGITISLLFTYSADRLVLPEFWISNLLFVALILLIFFLSMRPTHALLAAEKKRVLEPVTRRINSGCENLVENLDKGAATDGLPAEITALVVYEERLQAARTWPYNVTILRTLFFSVFIPLISILARVAVDLLFP